MSTCSTKWTVKRMPCSRTKNTTGSTHHQSLAIAIGSRGCVRPPSARNGAAARRGARGRFGIRGHNTGIDKMVRRVALLACPAVRTCARLSEIHSRVRPCRMCATGFASAEGAWALRRRDGGPGASYTAEWTFTGRRLRKGTGRGSGTPRRCHPARSAGRAGPFVVPPSGGLRREPRRNRLKPALRTILP